MVEAKRWCGERVLLRVLLRLSAGSMSARRVFPVCVVVWRVLFGRVGGSDAGGMSHFLLFVWSCGGDAAGRRVVLSLR